MYNGLEEDGAFSSVPKSDVHRSQKSPKEDFKTSSSYQNPKSFYKEIKSERNALFSSQGAEDHTPNYAMTERHMKIEDLNCDSKERNNFYQTDAIKNYPSEGRIPRWEENESKINQTIKNLISEKTKIEEDTMKIKKNPEILPQDKLKMLKSARNLSQTINTLLEKSQDRLSEFYSSQARDKSMSPGKQSNFGIKSLKAKPVQPQPDGFDMTNQADSKDGERINSLSSKGKQHSTERYDTNQESQKDPLLTSKNIFPSFRSDVAFNCPEDNLNVSPRFNQSKGGFEENLSPNTQRSQRAKSPNEELGEVKQLLYQAMKELETKNIIIGKFNQYKLKMDKEKEENNSRIQELLECSNEEANQTLVEQVKSLKQQLDNEKSNTNKLMQMFDGKFLHITSYRQNQCGYQYKDQLKYKDQLIAQFQEKNQALADKIDEVCNEKTILEEKYESIQNSFFEKENEDETTLVLTQKIEYLQEEIQEVSQAKHRKEVECDDLIQQLNDKEDVICAKNDEIQKIYSDFSSTEDEYQEHIKQLVEENEQLKQNCYQFQEELQGYKDKLEVLQTELTDIQSKSIDKDNDHMSFTKQCEDKSQEKISALREVYDSKAQELENKLEETMLKEQKECEENLRLQQTLYEIQAENERLKTELEMSKESIELSPQRAPAYPDSLTQSLSLKEELISKLKAKITSVKEQLANQAEEFREEKADLNSKITQLLTLTQKERVQNTTSSITTTNHLQTIEQLKTTLARQKETNSKLSSQNTNYLQTLHKNSETLKTQAEKLTLLTEKSELSQAKITDLQKKYDKAIEVIRKLEQENVDSKAEIEDLRDFKKQSRGQESKISVEYDNLLKEYKEQVQRLQFELARSQEGRYDESRMHSQNMTTSQMPLGYSHKQDMGRSMNERELQDHTYGHTEEEHDVNTTNNHLDVKPVNYRNSMPAMNNTENEEQYQEYFNQWAMSLK
ncbi:unnamed protein product [Moneuplotes crassus]|uniref:Uncharacterized protein n=1 Tax=Euplotes crassus TaxID=5936 RepID=A0AAD2D5Q3_EUPCR|nr:unnamed protein product [Moneuplotes crassus]